jgi:hypothetical protein
VFGRDNEASLSTVSGRDQGHCEAVDDAATLSCTTSNSSTAMDLSGRFPVWPPPLRRIAKWIDQAWDPVNGPSLVDLLPHFRPITSTESRARSRLWPPVL